MAVTSREQTASNLTSEAVTELENDRVEIRVLNLPDLISKQLFRRNTAALLIKLQSRAHFVTALRCPSVLQSRSDGIEVAESIIVRRIGW